MSVLRDGDGPTGGAHFRFPHHPPGSAKRSRLLYAGFLMQFLALSTPLFIGAGMKIAYDVTLYRAFLCLKPLEERGSGLSKYGKVKQGLFRAKVGTHG